MGKKRKDKLKTVAPSDPSVRDGGTGVREFSDCRAACASVPRDVKRRCFIMLGAAAVTLFVLFASRVLVFTEPLFNGVLGGLISDAFYFIILGVVTIAYMIALNYFLKRVCHIRLFKRKPTSVSFTRALGVIAIAAVAVFITSASLMFKLKIEYEIEQGSTSTNMLINGGCYFYYAMHLFYAFVAAALVQRALSTLVPAKYTVPWGAILLVTVFGLIEFILEYYTTTHKFTLVYYLFTFVYAAIFILTGRGLHSSYWASVIVMVL